jgi:conjugative relaxase-like TrwC/TraI family protein
MLRMVVSTNAEGAIKYFTDSLTIGDYYAEGQKCRGYWHGRGAEFLDLTGDNRSGEVTPKQFSSMAFNEHPAKGGPLTQRTITNRRVGYDINFHAPKSLSILYGLTGDERLLETFRWAVDETMKQMEREMKCRVRVGGAQVDRTVGNLCWAEFIHFTARPVDGRPDPHLHAHCFTFNAVYDDVEQKWKAGQFGDIKRDAPYFEACFHARLASMLVELGYPIERREKSWEIALVPQDENRKFSRRTAEIEATAEELGIHDAKRKSELGAKTRNRKDESRPLEELRKEWADLIEPKVREQMLRPVVPGQGSFGRGIEQTAESSVDLALSTVFERQSVVSERQCETAAIRNSLGSVHFAELGLQLDGDRRVIRKDIDDVLMMTTHEVMEEEKRMIAFARDGRGTRNPIAPDHAIKDQKLNDHQRAAVIDVLGSTDRVQIINRRSRNGKDHTHDRGGRRH